MLREEERPQFLRQGEGDHKVGSADALAQFAIHPFRGDLPAALRARPVVE